MPSPMLPKRTVLPMHTVRMNKPKQMLLGTPPTLPQRTWLVPQAAADAANIYI